MISTLPLGWQARLIMAAARVSVDTAEYLPQQQIQGERRHMAILSPTRRSWRSHSNNLSSQNNWWSDLYQNIIKSNVAFWWKIMLYMPQQNTCLTFILYSLKWIRRISWFLRHWWSKQNKIQAFFVNVYEQVKFRPSSMGAKLYEGQNFRCNIYTFLHKFCVATIAELLQTHDFFFRDQYSKLSCII